MPKYCIDCQKKLPHNHKYVKRCKKCFYIFIKNPENHPLYNKHHSEETKKKMSEKRKQYLFTHSVWIKGKHHSKETIKKMRLKALGRKAWNKGKKFPQISGKNHPFWKGKHKRLDGYILIYKPEHPFCDKRNYVYEHRLVMEKHLGRYLKPNEIIHHINNNRSDNRIENLQIFNNNGEHLKFHFSHK